MTSNTAVYGDEIRDIATSKKYFDVAYKAEKAGERVKAIEAYEAAYAADPDNTEVCFRLAINLDLVGEEDEALHLYEQAVQHERPHLNALLNLAVAYEDRAMYAQAERCLRQILATEPNHSRARLYIKDVLDSQEPGEDDQASTATASPLMESTLDGYPGDRL
ncbi:MAG: tetratricopeptide repeat protein [Phycisphaerales bacterium]|nr:tetratricopeptide repeat protein [Phycisphaerales bacterium]